MSSVSIIMYHYVRDLPRSRHPRINGRQVQDFRGQLAFLQRHYQLVTMAECLKALRGEAELPQRAALLSFDDGYIDHFQHVFPILNEAGIEGSFFPPARAVVEHEVLDVNKIHFIIASATDVEALVQDLFDALDEIRDHYQLPSNAWYADHMTVASRYDSKPVALVKRLLQKELPPEPRGLILHRLFTKYVTKDPAAFAGELYMSEDHLRCMGRNGMFIGSHSYDHVWLNTLTPAQQQEQVERSLAFLAQIGAPTDDWVMCYPYGGYDESLLQVLRQFGCKAGLTTKVGVAQLSAGNALTLERLDTNDLPSSL